MFKLDNTVVPTAFRYNIQAPEGFSFLKQGGEYMVSYSNRLDNDIYTLSTSKIEGENTLSCSANVDPEYSDESEYGASWIQPGTGVFVTIAMKAPEKETGTYQIDAKKICFETVDGTEYTSPDASIKVNVVVNTGISEVSDNDSPDAVYYNMQGVRISEPTEGICIRIAGGKIEKIILK